MLRFVFFSLLLSAGLCGCGRPADRAGSEFALERILERERGGRFESAPQLPRAFGGASEPWSVFVGAAGSPEDKLTFAAESRADAEGALELGAGRGGFCRSISVEPVHWLRVTAEADEGLSWVVYEFAEPISPEELAERDASSFAAEGGLLAAHTLEPTVGRERAVSFEPDPDCAALLAAVFSEAGVSGAAGALRVTSASNAVRIADWLGPVPTKPGFPPIGLARVGFEDRPCAVLGAGDVWSVPMEAGFDRLELGLALVPHRPGLAPTRGALKVELLATNGTRLESMRQEFSSEDRDRASWSDVRFDLTEDAAELRFTLEAIEESADAPLALIAAPRLRAVPERRSDAPASVVLLSIDTLRSDHLGAYGYGRAVSPNLDAFAAGALVFEDVWSQGAYTLPSHWSLMSGQFGSFHGVRDVRDVVVPERTGTLAAWLGGAGYETAAFTGAGYVTPEFGFDRGFDRFSMIDPVWNRESERAARFIAASPDLSREMAERVTVSTALDWLESVESGPAFLFLHTYAPHEFDPPRVDREALGLTGADLSSDEVSVSWVMGRATRPEGSVPEAQAARLIDLYDAAIHQADRELGPLLSHLAERREEFITVIVSDHGKEIGERGDVEHGSTLYEELLQVPLILSAPGVAPGRVAEPAMLVDVVPTLAELCGFVIDRPVQGRDLLGEAGARVLYSELDWAVERYASRKGSLKTIWTAPGKGWPDPSQDGEESYDLAVDPGELALLPEDGARVTELLAFRDAWRELAAQSAADSGRERAIAPETIEALRLLGYDVSE